MDVDPPTSPERGRVGTALRRGEMDADPPTSPERGRVGTALRRGENWAQLIKFSLVGGSGYIINLTVFRLLSVGLDAHYLVAAVGAFLVAVTNNYLWNRLWTFSRSRGHLGWQGARFLVVSLVALGANLVVLSALVALGVDEFAAQAVAVILVTPVNFVGNKLWSFRR